MILDLGDATGLPVSLDDTTCRLTFALPLSAMEPATRPADLLGRVYRDPTAVGLLAPSGLYFMYDGLARPEHRAALTQAGLRYDLTVLRPLIVGDEPVKTLGHYHTVAPGGLPYPELYQVVFGCAHFILQLSRGPRYEVEEVLAVEAHAGDAVLMPPGWGHVSVNAGGTPLVMCNWIAEACATVPAPYLETAGAACYEVRRPDGALTFLSNPRYETHCPETASEIPAGMGNLLPPGPIYTAGVADPIALRPLLEPSSFVWRKR